MTQSATEPAVAPESARSASGPRGVGWALPGWVQYVVVGAIFLLLLGAGEVLELGSLSLLTTILVMLVIAQGWNILGGYGGYLNLGIAAFFGTGAYASGIMFDRFGWSMFATLPVAGIAAVGLALLVGAPTLRLRGAYFAILTLVLGFLVNAYALVSSLTKGALGIFLVPPGTSPASTEQIFFRSALALALVAVAVAMLVERSKFGYALRAIREDEDAAEVLGVPTFRVKLRALMLGAVLAGLAGGLYAFRTAYIEPSGTFDVALSIDIVLMCVVGGAGTWQGPIIGVPLIMGLSEVLRVGFQRLTLFGSSVPVESNRLVLGVVLIVFALYASRGIVGLFRRASGRRFGV